MQTLFIGKNLIFLPQASSTNSYATQLLKNVNPPEGTLIQTAYQSGGKGQRGALWVSESGQNLTFSVILKPTFLAIENQFLLYQMVALACYDTITEIQNSSQIDIKIKWPNDILVDGKKLAGILIENSIQNSTINWSVLGIGLNVNQQTFKDSLQANSLKLISQKDYDLQQVLTVFCEHLEKYYLALINSKFEFMKQIYLERLFGLDQFNDYKIKQEIYPLRVKGITSEGLLQLEDRQGRVKIVDVKEAKLVK
jgi:BirA family biotin operon repressor/biotin-[acetyl-CoA-carboxylase] ligase